MRHALLALGIASPLATSALALDIPAAALRSPEAVILARGGMGGGGGMGCMNCRGGMSSGAMSHVVGSGGGMGCANCGGAQGGMGGASGGVTGVSGGGMNGGSGGGSAPGGAGWGNLFGFGSSKSVDPADDTGGSGSQPKHKPKKAVPPRPGE